MIAILVSVWLLGQLDPASVHSIPDPWSFAGNLLGNVTGFVFAAWLARHLLTDMIPRIITEFNSTQQKMAEQFTTSSEKQVQMFGQASEKLSTQFKEVLEQDRRFRQQELELMKSRLERTVCRFRQEDAESMSSVPISIAHKPEQS